jgi:mannose-1-phosphate guanylyltransferase
MEGAQKVALIPAEGLGWNDVGSWDSLFETLPVDENGNVFANCAPLVQDTTNTLVFNDGQERLIVTLGIDDLILVDTKDVLLVCRRDQGQKVREIVEGLKQAGRVEFL